MRLFLLRKPKNLEARRINYTAKEAKVIFQVVSAVIRIWLLPFTDISKQMVTNVCAECEEVFNTKKHYHPHIC